MRTRASLALLMLVFLLVAVLPVSQPRRATAQEEKPLEFRVLVRVLDADGEPLPGATVDAVNATSGQVITSAEANKTGWAELWIPNGTTCSIRAMWMEALVGELTNITVFGNMTLGPLNCTVCDLSFKVMLEEERIPLLNARVEIKANYTDVRGNSTAFTKELTTGPEGTCELEHALMNASYIIKAYRHGISKPFATVRLTGLNKSTTVEITCPSLDLVVGLVDEQMRPVEDATIEAWDWGTGLKVASAITDERGLVRLRVPFGYCLVKAILEGHVVAETKVLVVENMTWCSLTYRKPRLALRVLVHDVLGQPVPGLNVKLLDQEGNVVAEGTTSSDGTITFRELKAGAYRVEIYSGHDLLAIRSLLLRETKKLDVRLTDRIILLGHPVWLPAFLTALVGSLTALGSAIAVLLWRRYMGKKTL